MKKQEVQKEIDNFFKSKHKSSEVKKIKKLAMKNLIKLGNYRKKFCKKCYSMDIRTKSIKKGGKSVRCEDCGCVARYKIN